MTDANTPSTAERGLRPHALLTTAFVPLLPLDFERRESESIKAAARRDRLELASRLASEAITALRAANLRILRIIPDDQLNDYSCPAGWCGPWEDLGDGEECVDCGKTRVTPPGAREGGDQ